MEFTIPSPTGPYTIQLDAGTTTTFCGANGSGKTRLAVYIETKLGLAAHRISAHRALSLNPQVAKISEQEALFGLRTGIKQHQIGVNLGKYRQTYRWQGQEAVQLLNDFDYLVQALFADQAKTALQSHRRLRAGDCGTTDITKFEQLSEIWNRLLPDQELVIEGDNIKARTRGGGSEYAASEMSDGERAIFYLIGQTLAAENGSRLIVDEPELHLHPSIMTALWDELAAARQDCAFVFITHSLELAASRPGEKFIIRDCSPAPTWTLDPIPEHLGFSEEFTTLILGSRRPVLFVEGAHSSLDRIVYRSAYSDYLLWPLESCEAVIHAVATIRNTPELTRVMCQGIVDRDHRSPDDIEHLRSLGIEVLPVAEVENVVLLPKVSRAIAAHEGYVGDELEKCLSHLQEAVFELIQSGNERDSTVIRYTTRRIGRLLKYVDLSNSKSVQDLEQQYSLKVQSLNITSVASEFTRGIQSAIDNRNLTALLAIYDSKRLFELAATHLKKCKVKSLKSWLERALSNGSVPQLADAIRESLPKLTQYSAKISEATIPQPSDN